MSTLNEVREVFSALATNYNDLTLFIADREAFLDNFVLKSGDLLSQAAKNDISFDVNRLNWQFYITPKQAPAGSITASKNAETINLAIASQPVVAKHSNGSPFVNTISASGSVNATDKEGTLSLDLDTQDNQPGVLTTVVFAVALRPGKTTSDRITAPSDQTILIGPDLPVRASYTGSTATAGLIKDRDVHLSGFIDANNQTMLLAFRDYTNPSTE